MQCKSFYFVFCTRVVILCSTPPQGAVFIGSPIPRPMYTLVVLRESAIYQ